MSTTFADRARPDARRTIRVRLVAHLAAAAVALGLMSGCGGSIIEASGGPVEAAQVDLEPIRILDTRVGLGIDGRVTDGARSVLQVTGDVDHSGDLTVPKIPDGTRRVTLRFTVKLPDDPGVLAVGPVESISFQPGPPEPVDVDVELDTDGSIELALSTARPDGSTHLVGDVVAFQHGG